jgi:hypothetical protein
LGSAVLTDDVLAENTAERGGGIEVEYTTVTLKESGVEHNKAAYGGGVLVGSHGTLVLTEAAIIANSATEKGGGIANYYGLITGSHSTVAANTAREGRNIFNEGGTNTLKESFVES